MKECSSAASIPKGLKIDNKHVPDMVMTDMKNAVRKKEKKLHEVLLLKKTFISACL
jgi:hypothetical protein